MDMRGILSTFQMVEAYYASVARQAFQMLAADAVKHDLNFAFVIASLFFAVEVFRRRRTMERTRRVLMKIIKDVFISAFAALVLYVCLNFLGHFIMIPVVQTQTDHEKISSLEAQITTLTNQQNKKDSQVAACDAGYNGLLNALRYPFPNSKNSDLEEIIRERQLLLDARTKNDPTAYPLHMALESSFGIYLRQHPDPCEEK